MNKKIAILTWLYNGNYGTVLQAYALQSFLRKNNYNVENLNYRPSLKTKLINWAQNGNSPMLFLGKFKTAFSKKSCNNQDALALKDKRIEEFKKQNMVLTKVCRTPEELAEVSKDYDVYICGSDQIWSPALMNPVYYFSYLPQGAKKIAYAPSFGVTQTTNKKRQKIKEYLTSFNHLSVREMQGQELIKDILGKDVPLQIDPTMLLEAEDWNACTAERLVSEDYIFCYLLTPNEKYIEMVRQLAEKTGLKVVIVPTPKGPFDTGFDELIEAGPAEWLSLIKYAKFVCTDSFHGGVFSSIFNVQFWLFKRFSDSDKKSENSRIYTLVKRLGIVERVIGEDDAEKLLNGDMIDFVGVDKAIQSARENSSQWLVDAINQELAK